MKKISTLLITMILIFALSLTSFAANGFSDVQPSAWYYEAVKEIAATGIIEGMPDGTFQPDRELSRKEMAMVIHRLLNKINEERKNMQDVLNSDINSIEDEIEIMAEGLTTKQAQDVESICLALIEQNQPDLPKDLTEAQAEEVANLIQQLTKEYQSDLKKLEVDLAAQKQLSTMRYNDTAGKIEGLNQELAAKQEKLDELQEALDQQKAGLEDQEQALSDQEEATASNIDDLNATIAALKDEIGGLESELTALKNEVPLITFKTPKYNVNYSDYTLEKGDTDTNPYLDPYNPDINKKNDPGHASNQYGTTLEEEFYQQLDLGVNINKDGFNANLGLGFVKEDFFNSETNSPILASIKGVINANGFKATIDNEQKKVSIRNYLYSGHKDDIVNGVVADINGDTYVVDANVLAGETTFSDAFMGKDLEVAVGIENLVDERNIVVGLNPATAFDFGGFDVTPELAFSDKNLQERYMKIAATGDLGTMTTDFIYEKDTGLETIADANYQARLGTFSNNTNGDKYGYQFKGEMDLFNITGIYEDYHDAAALRLDASQEFAGVDTTFEYDKYLNDPTSSRYQFKAVKSMDFEGLGLTGTFNKISFNNRDIDDGFVDNHTDYYDYDESKDEETEDKILKADYNISGVDTSAEYTLRLDNKLKQKYTADYKILSAEFVNGFADDSFSQKYVVNYDPTDVLSTTVVWEKDAGDTKYEQEYTADFASGLVNAGVSKYINTNDNATIMTAGLNEAQSEAMDIMDVAVKPYFTVGYKLADGIESQRNYALGLNADKQVNDKISLEGEMVLADREFYSYKEDAGLTGEKRKNVIKLNYNISADVSANLKYENLKFDSEDDTEDYEVKLATGGLTVSF